MLWLNGFLLHAGACHAEVPQAVRQQLDEEILGLEKMFLALTLCVFLAGLFCAVDCLALVADQRIAKMFGTGDIAQCVAERLGLMYRSSCFGRLGCQSLHLYDLNCLDLGF